MKSTINRTINEKRHTKPCRFFQKGTCPLTADRCDFAHVKIQIFPVEYSTGHFKPFQARLCGQGESLKLAAPLFPTENGMPKPAILHAVAESGPPSSVDAMPVARCTHVPPSHKQPNLTHSPAAATEVSPGHKICPYRPVLLPPVSGWQPVALATSPDSVSSEDLAQLIFRGGDSSPISDVPSLSDGDSDPPSAACEAPELAERWPGSPPVQSPMVYYNPTPGLSPPGVPFTNPAYGPWFSPKQATRSESRRPGMSARKLKALKTKQCKFFKKDGCCPQGSQCTFVHDPSAIQAPKSTQESPSSDTSESGSTQSSSQLHSKIEEDPERTIFPVTWRVIGGGVMMGGQREVCKRFKDGVCPEGDDCPYAHPGEGTLDHFFVLVLRLLTPVNRIDDRQIPFEALSPTMTPRASNFSQEQTHVMTDSSTEQTAVPALPVPELIPDISPIVLRGREALSTRSVREGLPARPLSTPPRMNSYTEAGRPDDKVYSVQRRAF
ncbi:hypothetical protein BJV78DRAFT_1156429 [Lactifluus subvellereus]|nr:hypothetical protein BJV78DRAFT_1156429 [Lactifluus subvellereus]